MVNQDFPDAFESLAATAKFIGMSEIDPEFYQKYYHAIEMTCAFVRLLATSYPELETVFRKTLSAPVRYAGHEIGQVIPRLNWDEKRAAWVDAQLTEVLKQLLPVVADESMNPCFADCKWAIEGAFRKK